jgi:STE24 endopeptidase
VDTQIFQKAKRYSAIKYTFAIIDIIYLLILLFIFLGAGLSKSLESSVSRILVPSLAIPAYILIASLMYYLLDFPFNLYRSFLVEHKFCLSTQKIGDWIKDQLKQSIISYIILLILIFAFYVILAHFPHSWWLVVSVFWIFFSLILARFTPVLIIPLFFKYKKLSDETLRSRILNLADKMQIKILDCFQIDFSKKTLKANAAFVGIGHTKRVILADTLKDKYSYDEIEVILAHEFAHYRLKHLLKLIFINSLVVIFSFYLIFKTSTYALNLFGFVSLSEIAAMPIMLIYFTFFGIITQPIEAYLSRRLERNADKMALKTTGLKDAFISMMDKLAVQNLSDRSPHPIIKFFFFDHPPIDERIAFAKSS